MRQTLKVDDLGRLETLRAIRNTMFFSVFCMDIFAPCKVLCQEAQSCSLECEVEPFLEVPAEIRERDEAFSYVLDAWSRWDPPNDAEYYDLRKYPEAYTGYDGRDVWKFIYSNVAYVDPAVDTLESDVNCMVSAFHASITYHILEDCTRGFREIHGGNPLSEVVDSLQTARALLLRAVQDAATQLLSHDYGDEAHVILPLLRSVVSSPRARPVGNATQMMVRDCKLRMRELCTVMDCVQCNVCRMHAKVATLGLATALRVLCGDEGDGVQPSLSRVEIAALLVTLEKFTDALRIQQRFAESG